MKKRMTMMLLIVAGIFLLAAQEPPGLTINRWLILGPMDISETETTILKEPSEILNYHFIPLDTLAPDDNGKVIWNSKETPQWRPAEAITAQGLFRQVAYLAIYLDCQRWLKCELTLPAPVPAALYLDGEPMATAEEGKKLTTTLTLDNAKHLLIVKAILPQGKKGEYPFQAELKVQENLKNTGLTVSLTPEHRVRIDDVLNLTMISSGFISPDGRLAALKLSRQEKNRDKAKTWFEIVSCRNGQTLFRSENIDDFKWLSDSQRFSFTKTTGELTSLYLYDLKDHSQKELLGEMKKFSEYWWASGNRFLIYSTSKEDVSGKGYKYIKDIPSRSRTPQESYALTLFFPESRVSHPLSTEKENVSEVEISPDGKKILMTSNQVDYQNRPYQKNRFFLYDVEQASKKLVLESNWINEVSWSPDSKKILCLGGPSAFAGLGKNLKEDRIPNDYDIQAYIYDPESNEKQAISREFDPSIESAYWVGKNKIYFRVTEQSFNRLYLYEINNKRFIRLSTLADVVSGCSLTGRGQAAVYWGSGINQPQKLYFLDLAKNRTRLLRDFNSDRFRQVRFGSQQDWNFTSTSGKTITGTLYFPPDFDPQKKYPAIVYFYGGTTPVTRDYGGRYPKEWYTANGYIVYMLQPSGAIGFGQDFSAVHVNDWGKITSQEIIEGTQELLRTHPSIDPLRLGAMGASYGGFLSQYLAAKTNIFAAHISHAGISALASYWGIGDYGYNYSGRASALSFPWNRKDLYVDHSPLYMADKISRPLLLLHGDIDNNVPPGESYQMYAALKLLGKEVALVTFDNQQHFIQEPSKRIQWLKTIIAWFDRWLKNQPEQWNELYGK